VGVDDDLGRTPVQQGADTRPAAAVCLCTIFSCHRVGGYYKPDFFGVEEEDAPELYRRASPLDRVDDQTPPLLLVVGDADETTPVAGHEAMVERVCGAGGRAELHILPGVGHGYGYGVETPAQQETLRWAEAFLAPVLGVPETQA
jgi:dipeptidyl aminopeptidase/acylaminoacyl peptidase